VKALSYAALQKFAEELRSVSNRICRRELLCAASGLKPVRLMPHVDDAQALVALVRTHGLAVQEGRHSAWIRLDTGKGGWSSGSAEAGRGEEHRLLYVACDAADALRLREAEESGCPDTFGRELLIPQCCREMFCRNAAAASVAQNDFFGFTFRDVYQVVPRELNLVAQYFDAALVSHYPCAPHCAQSLRIARIADRITAVLLPDDARVNRELMRQLGLYSEHDGICLVRSKGGEAGWFAHAPDEVRATEDGRLVRALRQSTHFRASGTLLEFRCREKVWSESFDGVRILEPMEGMEASKPKDLGNA